MYFSLGNTLVWLSIFMPLLVNRSVWDISPVVGYLPSVFLLLCSYKKNIQVHKVLLGVLVILTLTLSTEYFDTPKSINIFIVYSLLVLLLSCPLVAIEHNKLHMLDALSIAIFIIGLFQMFNYLELNSRDIFYFTDLLPFSVNRMTSLFIEPSACGMFFVMITYLQEKLKKKPYPLGYHAVILTFSTQAIGILLLLKTLQLNFRRNIGRLRLGLSIIILSLFAPIFFSQLQQRIETQNFGHRISGPLIALDQVANDFETTEILFGKGAGTLDQLTDMFTENAPTTHNLYIDLLYETGVLGLTAFLIFFMTALRKRQALYFFVVILGVGYRSPEIVGIALMMTLSRSRLVCK